MIHWIWAAFFASIIDRLFRRRKNAEIAAKRYDTEWQSWNNAFKPDATDLIGTWEVTVLSGALPNTRRIGHVKVIKPHKGKLRGYNRTLGTKWGRFSIGFSKDCVIFQYGKVDFFDKVRRLNRNFLIGQYRLLANNSEYQIAGYFQMRRKELR